MSIAVRAASRLIFAACLLTLLGMSCNKPIIEPCTDLTRLVWAIRDLISFCTLPGNHLPHYSLRRIGNGHTGHRTAILMLPSMVLRSLDGK